MAWLERDNFAVIDGAAVANTALATWLLLAVLLLSKAKETMRISTRPENPGPSAVTKAEQTLGCVNCWLALLLIDPVERSALSCPGGKRKHTLEGEQISTQHACPRSLSLHLGFYRSPSPPIAPYLLQGRVPTAVPFVPLSPCVSDRGEQWIVLFLSAVSHKRFR